MEKRNFSLITVLLLALAAPAGAQTGATSTPFWTGMTDAAAFDRAMDARLAHARRILDGVVAAKGPRTVDNTLRPYDDVLLELDAVGSQSQLVQSVHPVEAMRQTAGSLAEGRRSQPSCP